MSVQDVEARVGELQRQYVDFLDDNDGPISQSITKMMASNCYRIVLNINELRARLPERARAMLGADAFLELSALGRALRERVAVVDDKYARAAPIDFAVAIEGSLGANHVSPRTLISSFLHKLVCVEGIVTKASLVKPKIVRSVHYCPATKKFTERSYSDLTSLDSYPSGNAYPTADEDGNPLQTEYGLSVYEDNQSLTIQELPERAPTGQLPRSVDVLCQHRELVDLCKPGDRVQIVGTFRCLPSKMGGHTTGIFRTVVVANHVVLKANSAKVDVDADDVQRCRDFSRQMGKKIFDTLARSLAPSIHGHQLVKKALLCQLLGGVEKVLDNGTRLRGDINVLLIGDPSVAKSQLLRYVYATASRAVTTTGRGSSGVGLTAAVTTDPESGERSLEAGAMVLADRGVVCIDEFDKMSDADRTAIHEVMEQGRVSVQKAGVHAHLNARCAVLAAANPVFGRYDAHRTPMDNIGLQDSLLSRFDLLFVLLDQADTDMDRRIADHVINASRYRNPKEVDGAVTSVTGGGALSDWMTGDSNNDSNKDGRGSNKHIWERYDHTLHGGKRGVHKKEKCVTLEFIRKYIEVAKTLRPTLTDDACETIGEEYSRLRSTEMESANQARTQPVTARALETLIRLSTAHAKARFSNRVERQDAKLAIELVRFAYFKEVLAKEKRRKRRHSEDSDYAETESEDEDADQQQPRAKTPRTEETPSTVETTMETEQQDDSQPTQVDKEQLKSFMVALKNLYDQERSESLALDLVNQSMAEKGFQLNVVKACLEKMSQQNKIMESSGRIYRI